ncbi:raffinose/stachyose/melibiose transport system permease protein [Curtobacterium sp. PhB130]|uniref:carbohydrate ABC transporter permease n=1 Tax=unclassified Curtobacterium TaxID=257496 RepID=UPI000F4D024B|nr:MULTISPECIES: carbohydrate ABC transporter permease [unclassified Curtobacterium]ROP60945.1 raffinose/stachyose/melibiose transport system permease protein [Curtobacterium sp. ZW137]ROS75981.1 raffinose/stachyose/melibiose transport system permease protein [Curtobacterium sp. PhB130]
MTVQAPLNTRTTLTGSVRSVDADKTHGRRGRGNWTLTIVLVVCAFSVLIPLYVTLSMAFKTTGQAVDGNAFSLPAPFSVQGFVEAWQLTDFPRAFGVSVMVAAITVVGTILLASFAAYAIARNWERRLFRWSFFYLLAAMFLPFPVLALSQVKLTGMVGLDNPFGVAILHVMFQLSFSVMLFTAFLRSIPGELEESARIDGASTWQVFWQLVFPLLAPMSATVGIFAFLASWNDYMMPALITADPALQTLPVLQQIFQTQFSNNYNVSFASYLMAMAPAIIVYLVTQRWVMAGVTQGAIK